MDEQELNMDVVTPQDSQDTHAPETQPRSRHIPREVVSKLLEDARGRCCLCRVLIDPQRYDSEAQFGSLEKHHIIYFSEGGGNTYDNLLLVCANCHTQIHAHSHKYPVEELRDKKLHWIGMKAVVPAELSVTDETNDTIQVPFSVESLNLQYSILVPSQATVSELALFLRDRILKPLGEYDHNDDWIHPDSVRLAQRSAPKEPFHPSLPLWAMLLPPGDVLIARIPRIVMLHKMLLHRRGPGRHPWEPEIVPIPAGRFWMGTNRLKQELAGIPWKYWMEDETPCRPIYLPDYAIGKYPVTNAQYAAFVKATGHKFPKHWDRARPPSTMEDHPVVNVSWHDAVAYCDWLAQLTSKPYRLPSEAEWEKAARGTGGRIYPWGNKWDSDRCNSSEAGPRYTTPVGAYPQGASPYGLLDMAGNVWEWTRSLWGESWEKPDFGYPYDPEDGREDLEAGEDVLRVLRGGTFNNILRDVRCACRFRLIPNFRYWDRGFRVCTVPQQN